MEISVARPAADDADGKVNVRNVSKATPSVYTVTVDCEGNVTDCTCPDHSYGGNRCKHARRISAEDAALVAVTGNIDAGRPSGPDCPECDEMPGEEWLCADCYISGDRSLPSEPRT
jgi:hypothetical protein